jgi:hypothetical protein
MTGVVRPSSDVTGAGARRSNQVTHASRSEQLKSLARRTLGPQVYSGARAVFRLARGGELRAPFPVTYKLDWWRRGFHADMAALYEFPQNDWRDYVSDYMRFQRCISINSTKQLFDQKPVFKSFLIANGFPQAQTVALISRGEILMHPFGSAPQWADAGELERWLLQDGGRFFAKPQGGAYGRGIFLIEVKDGVLMRRRGTESQPLERSDWTSPLIVERWVEQGAFWRDLFPESTNTIRALTLWTPGDPKPFIARAVQRAGTADTIPTDNFSGGGVSSLIDLDTGRLGVGRIHPVKGKRPQRAYTHHPDSGAVIEGSVVPHWDRVRDTVLRAAACLPTNPYVGWDVLVDESGTPVIIEGNGNTNFSALQVHGGLLTDPAVRRFYQKFNVL